MRLSNEIRTVLKGCFKAYREGASVAREGLSGSGRHRDGVQVLVPTLEQKRKEGKKTCRTFVSSRPSGEDGKLFCHFQQQKNWSCTSCFCHHL